MTNESRISDPPPLILLIPKFNCTASKCPENNSVMESRCKYLNPGIFWSVKSRNVCAGTFYCHAMKQIRTFHRMMRCYIKAAKYEIQKPSTCPATLFRNISEIHISYIFTAMITLYFQHCFFASFCQCFPFFTLRDQLGPQQKHLLRVEEKYCEK